MVKRRYCPATRLFEMRCENIGPKQWRVVHQSELLAGPFESMGQAAAARDYIFTNAKCKI